MPYIIIPDKPHKFGKTRSEQEKNLRKEGWGKALTDEQLDKCEYLERKARNAQNVKKSFFDQSQIGQVK